MKFPNFFSHKPQQPISAQMVTRLMLIIIVCLALAAGYYHNATLAWRKNYSRLETRYEALELKSARPMR